MKSLKHAQITLTPCPTEYPKQGTQRRLRHSSLSAGKTGISIPLSTINLLILLKPIALTLPKQKYFKMTH